MESIAARTGKIIEDYLEFIGSDCKEAITPDEYILFRKQAIKEGLYSRSALTKTSLHQNTDRFKAKNSGSHNDSSMVQEENQITKSQNEPNEEKIQERPVTTFIPTEFKEPQKQSADQRAKNLMRMIPG